MSEIKKKEVKGGKKVNRRTFLKTTGMAAGAVAFSGFHFVRHTQAATGPFKVGFPIPLTGPYGTEALDQQAGAELAIAEVNAGGGVLGRKVELVVRDTQLKAAEAARRAKELLEAEKVELMSGALSASNQLAINQLAKEHGVPYVSVSQANEITQRQDNSVYTYHEALDPHTTTQAVGEWVGKNFGKRWYYLTSDYAYGWQMTDGFKRKGREFGAIDVGETKHPLGTSDYSSYMPRILAANPDVLLLNNFGKDQLNSIKQATAFGLKKKMQLVCPIILMSARIGAGWEAYDGVAGGTSFDWGLDHSDVQAICERFSKDAWPSADRLRGICLQRHQGNADGHQPGRQDWMRLASPRPSRAGLTTITRAINGGGPATISRSRMSSSCAPKKTKKNMMFLSISPRCPEKMSGSCGPVSRSG